MHAEDGKRGSCCKPEQRHSGVDGQANEAKTERQNAQKRRRRDRAGMSGEVASVTLQRCRRGIMRFNKGEFVPHPTLSHPLLEKEFPVLDHGSIMLVDFMGTEEDITRSARNSYKKGTKHVSDDETLLRYLMRHRHTTPFERCQVALHVKLPIFVERQWARHRTAGWNEVSARYSELPEETYTPEPEDVCLQSKTNRQGRAEQADSGTYHKFLKHCELSRINAFGAYHDDLANDIARETARINLPLSTYTEKTWWVNLHNLLGFLSLRMDSHAQKEVRVFADIIGHEIVAKLFPKTWLAFLDYRLNAMSLSWPEWKIIGHVLQSMNVTAEEFSRLCGDRSLWPENASQRERNELSEKIGRLFA